MRERRWRPVSASWVLTVKDPRLQVTTIAYNTFGQPLSVQGPIATEPPTTFAYDTNGNLITTTDPLGNATQRVYDAVSRLTALTDPRGLQTQFRYDGLNRVTEIADARQGITRFSYDPNGNLLTVADAKNQTTSYTYDSMDRLSTRKDALNRSESYQYDLAGNLSQFTDRKNQQTTFAYDALNRRTTATYPDSTTSFIYDSVGRLTKASDTATGAGTIDFAYDTLDRLIQEVTGQGSVSYQYDVLGRRTNMVANGQQPVGYTYDAASRLTQVAQSSLAVGLGYDNANRRTSLTYPNGTSTSYTYDVASRLTTINHIGPSGIIEALTYQYDAAGNRTSLARNNGTASLLPSAVASATYDAANEQTQFAGATLAYDANGNLISDGVNTYQWDARNRLVSISGGATATFNYDALGRRTSKTVNGVASQFAYDGNDISAEIGGGAVGASYLSSLNIDEPFIRQTSTGNEHFHTDALGSSLALSNAQGSSAITYTYEPFGKTTVTGTSASAFQYTGRENDGTGLYYARTRYYNPSLGRFIQQDPIGFWGGDLNLYAYVHGNPMNLADPYGLAASVSKISISKNEYGNTQMDISLVDGQPNTKGIVDITYGQVPELPGGGLTDLNATTLPSVEVKYGPYGKGTIKGVDINEPRGPQTYLIVKPREPGSPPAIVTGFPQNMEPHTPCSPCRFFSGYGGPKKHPTGGGSGTGGVPEYGTPFNGATGKKLGGRK